jgi:hypothetical protein
MGRKGRMSDTYVLAKAYHDKILSLKRGMAVAFISLAEILREIKDKELFIPLGYDTFYEYVQSPEVGLNLRTAYYYMEIHETFIQKLGYKREELADYSYDKLRKLLPIVGKEDAKVEEVMTNANVLKWSDFEKHYKDEKENEGFSDKLSAPEFYRCKDCGKWVISLPVSDCCREFLVEFNKAVNKELTKGENGYNVGKEE